MRTLGYPYPNQSGQFTGTLSGYASPPNGTFTYQIVGKTCTLTLVSGNLTGTSNATTMVLNGMPSFCLPVSGSPYGTCAQVVNNGTDGIGEFVVSGSGVAFTILTNAGSGTQVTNTTFTASGTKGLDAGWSISYPLN